MAPVGVAGGIRVVLEEVDVPVDSLFAETVLCVNTESLKDSLASSVV
jgi:hypothetical protein